MRGKVWIEAFMKSLKTLENESYGKTDAGWTTFIGKVLKEVGRETRCYVAMKYTITEENEHSGEYLGIDAWFIDNADFDDWDNDNWDPPVLPSAVAELENSYDLNQITYDLWKMLCIRAPVRVLICYQSKADEVKSLRMRLEDVIQQRGLMKGAGGELLVIIGNDSVSEESEWSEYFKVFEWRYDGLETYM